MTSFWKHALAGFAVVTMASPLAAQDTASDYTSPESGVIQSIASFPDNRPTGVAVSSAGRVFVNFPYSGFSDERHKAAVVEIAGDGTVTTLLEESWNDKARPAAMRFVNIQSLTVDSEDRLWLLDTGSPQRQGVVEDGAKLIEVDIAAGDVVRTYPFSPEVVSGSDYLNDVRVDALKNFAYITDSVRGGVLVLNLTTGHCASHGRPLERCIEAYLTSRSRTVQIGGSSVFRASYLPACSASYGPEASGAAAADR